MLILNTIKGLGDLFDERFTFVPDVERMIADTLKIKGFTKNSVFVLIRFFLINYLFLQSIK